MTYLQKKKLAFMSIVNKVKGFVRTVTGIPPLTLPNCVDEKSIINYTISGNSVQNGTPSANAPVEIESVGEKTVNLFDVNNPILTTGYVSSNKLMGYADKVDNTSQTISIVLNIKPNTDYTVSRKLLGSRFSVGVSSYAPASNIAMTKYISGYVPESVESVTITSGETDKYLYVWFYNKNYDTYTYQELMQEIQVVEGAEVLPFEPYGYKIPVKVSDGNAKNIITNIYLNEPLRKVGSYAEQIDYENQKIVNPALITIVLTGKENWTLRSGQTNTFQFWYGTTVNGGFCSHYEQVSLENLDKVTGICKIVNTSYFYISDLNCNSVADFKAFLSSQYENGTPVTIMTRQINTEPTETDIDLPKLPTFKGTTIYSIETTIQPSNMSATYYSTSKGD